MSSEATLSMRDSWCWESGGVRHEARPLLPKVWCARLPPSLRSPSGGLGEEKAGQSLHSAWTRSPFPFQHIHWQPCYPGHDSCCSQDGGQGPKSPAKHPPSWELGIAFLAALSIIVIVIPLTQRGHLQDPYHSSARYWSACLEGRAPCSSRVPQPSP